MPGLTALTRIFRPASSFALLIVRELSAPFDDTYGPAFGGARSATSELTFTIAFVRA